MWNMMCDVMPTISEDSISQRSSQFGGGGGGAGGADDANFEQLMVSMLDERDKLVDSLKNEQEKTAELEARNRDLEKERDSLNRQLNQNLPQVSPHPFHPLPPCREREGAPLFWSESPLAASKHPPPSCSGVVGRGPSLFAAASPRPLCLLLLRWRSRVLVCLPCRLQISPSSLGRAVCRKHLSPSPPPLCLGLRRRLVSRRARRWNKRRKKKKKWRRRRRLLPLLY